MNIGIITTWFPSGAGYVSRAYREILDKDFKVFIYARAGKKMKGDLIWDDGNVTWGPDSHRITGINIRHFRKWLQINKIEICLFNEQRYWKPILVAKDLGIKVGAYIDYYTQETVPFFSVYDYLICNTARHYSVFRWHPNAIFVPWGTSNFPNSAKNTINEKLTFITSCGWQSKSNGDRRGTMLAMEALQHVNGNCEFLVYSQVSLKDSIPEFRNLVKSDKRIKLIEGTYEPFPYDRGDVYIYPSRLDGIGLTLPEAISCGLAVITTDASPMNEFVIDNFNGQLIPVEKYLGRSDAYYWAENIVNVKDIANAMQLYINNRSLVYLHQANARIFAEENLNWYNNSKDLAQILKKSFNKNLTSSDLLKTINEYDNSESLHVMTKVLLSKYINMIKYFFTQFDI